MNKKIKTPDEEVRDFPGYEGLYAVSKSGKVWSYLTSKWMHPGAGKSRYRIVNLSKDGKSKSFYLHRLVAITWLPNPDNLPEVNHKNEDRGNCHVDNLEWCQHSYNIDYSKCKKVYCVELNRIFNSIKEASRELNILQCNISAVLCGRGKTASGYHFTYYKGE